MKLLLLGVILLSFNISAKAITDECQNCVVKHARGTAINSLPEDFRGLAAIHTQLSPIEDLGTSICMTYSRSLNIGEDINNIISNYIVSNNIGNGDEKSIVKFLNENKDVLNCPDLKEEGTRRNIVKMAISENVEKQLIYKYLFRVSKKSGIKVDFNSVELINGTYETPLDYIDNIIDGKTPLIVDDSFKNELHLLRDRLVKRFGAKKFLELPIDIQKKYKANMQYARR